MTNKYLHMAVNVLTAKHKSMQGSITIWFYYLLHVNNLSAHIFLISCLDTKSMSIRLPIRLRLKLILICTH